MVESVSLKAFSIAALIVLIIPGPGVLYVVTRSLTQGQRAGIVSVLGLSAGAFVHVLAATAGVSALLLTSAAAFSTIKYLGAAYLILLGVKALLTHIPSDAAVAMTHRTHRKLFTDGIIVSVLNPKIAVFFLAFLPQFADPAAGPISHQILLLGTTYVLLAIITDSAYAIIAGHLREGLGNRVMHGQLPQYASGLVYLGLGISTALTDRR